MLHVLAKRDVFVLFVLFFWPTVKSSLWHVMLSVCRLSSSSVVCKACIVAKPYAVGGRRWYRWIGRWRVPNFYKLFHVSICSGLPAIYNAKLLPAATTHVGQITASYPSVDWNVWYSSVIIAYMKLQSLWEIFIFPRPEVER